MRLDRLSGQGFTAPRAIHAMPENNHAHTSFRRDLADLTRGHVKFGQGAARVFRNRVMDDERIGVLRKGREVVPQIGGVTGEDDPLAAESSSADHPDRGRHGYHPGAGRTG